MFRSFFTALLWSLPHSLLVATIAFPAALIAFGIGLAAIWLVPVLLVIPFLLPIMIFLGGHFSWTVAARFAAGWAGLGAYTKRMPFMNGFWNAFGLVLVFYLLWAVVSWAVLFGLAEWQAADQTGAANQVNALLSRYGVRIGWWL